MTIKLSGSIRTKGISPLDDATYDLGSSSFRWRDGYFNRTVNNYAAFANIPFTVTVQDHRLDDDAVHLLGVTPMWDVLRFKDPNKIEKWDEATSSWVDVTTDPNYTKYKYWFRGVPYTITIPNGSTEHLRFTFNIGEWSHGKILIIWGHKHCNKIKLKFEVGTDGTTWIATYDDYVGKTDHFAHVAVIPDISSNSWIRITLTWEWLSAYTIDLFGIHLWSLSSFNPHQVFPFTWDATNLDFKFTEGNVRPSTDNSYDLGSSSYRWKNVFGYTLNILDPGRTIGANPANAEKGWIVLRNAGASLVLGIDNNEIACKGGDLYIESTGVVRFIPLGGAIVPHSDNAYDLGSSTLRWKNVYADNVISGDLSFEEKVCPVCNEPFIEGDELVLKVKRVNFNYTRTFPIHLKCSDIIKEVS